MNVITLHLFERKGSMPDDILQTVAQKTDGTLGKPLLCAFCYCMITSEGESIDVQGNHFHTCTNPADIIFNIRCFNNAPGCSPIGAASAEHTWFSGYRWQIALCKDCGEHLGWLFKGGDSFYGLIADRLTCE